MQNEDKIRLQHMADACTELLSFMEGKSKDDLNSDRKLVLSIIKEIEIIGEAANKISGEIKKAHTEIPWTEIVTMRNRLIHTYFDVDLDVVWSTAIEDIPRLLSQIEKLLQDR